MLDRLFRRLPMERILLFASLALGALHEWFGRYSMNPDGISYLDLGDFFFRRDWANAVNAYWSPLYPWTLGVVLGITKPSPKWEFPLVHLVNFGVFVAALFAFRFLLHAFIAFDRGQSSDKMPNANAKDGQALPEWALVLLVYSTFWWLALELVAGSRSGDALRRLTRPGRDGMHLRHGRDAIAPPAGRRVLEVRSVWPPPRGWILDESNLVPNWLCNPRRGLFMETHESRLGKRYRASRSGLSLRLRSADPPALSSKKPVHIWRFGQARLCLVCVSPHIEEKLAGRSSRQRDPSPSDPPINEIPAAI